MEFVVPTARRIFSGQRATISQYLATVFGAYALLGLSPQPWWRNLFVVSVLGAGTVLILLLTAWLRERRLPAPELGESAEGAAALNVERRTARNAGARFWWEGIAGGSGPRWYENVLVIWHKRVGLDARRLRFAVHETDLREMIDGAALPPASSPSNKAGLVEVSGLLTDEDPCATFRRHDWELSQFAQRNYGTLRDTLNVTISYFGVEDWPNYPGNACVHGIVETRDGRILLCLRRPGAAYFPVCWSGSFEEQIRLDVPGEPGDANALATTERALKEEFGINPDEIDAVRIMALGIERVLVGAGSNKVLVNSGSFLVVARLQLDHRELFERIGQTDLAEDHAEHVAWIAASLSPGGAVSSLLNQFPTAVTPNQLRENRHVNLELALHKDSDFKLVEVPHEWHPTTRLRLFLWSQWREEESQLSDRDRNRPTIDVATPPPDLY